MPQHRCNLLLGFYEREDEQEVFPFVFTGKNPSDFRPALIKAMGEYVIKRAPNGVMPQEWPLTFWSTILNEIRNKDLRPHGISWYVDTTIVYVTPEDDRPFRRPPQKGDT